MRVQVGHFASFAATPEGTSVTVRVNGANAIQNFRFGDVTNGYVDLGPAGNYLIEIVPTGTSTVAISANLTNLAAGNYTVLAIGNGTLQPLALLPLTDDITPPPAGQVKLRVVHAAPFGNSAAATAVSIRTDGGDVVGGLSSVPFRGASPFLTLPAASYDLKVATPDGTRNLIDLAPVNLAAGTIITVAAVGDGGNQALGFVGLPGGRLATETPVALRGAGLWFDPATDGQGLALYPVPRENRIVGTWYAYGAGGTQRWFTVDSTSFDGRIAKFTVRETSGGVLGGAQRPTLTVVGTASLSITDCNRGTFQWTLGTATGTYNLTNLVPAAGCQ
ncbi:MAG: DUF4397 domain-containing protein [Xanthomonadaceae bacterium]|nr:DUF4397 domain-containing protein [Xanthomonadaceae bacterium]